MRPYKSATLIAKSIIKMIEDSGGGSIEISGAAVLLPAPIFDGLLQDIPTQADDPAELVRIRGIAFERVASRRRRKRKAGRNATIAGTPCHDVSPLDRVTMSALRLGWHRSPPPRSGQSQTPASKMSNSKVNRWTAAELDRLRSLLDAGKTAREIAVELERTPLAIYGQVQRIYRKRDPAKGRGDPGDRD